MKQNNCKSETVRAGTRRQACRRVPAVPCTTHRAESIPLSLALFHFALCPFTLVPSLEQAVRTSNRPFCLPVSQGMSHGAQKSRLEEAIEVGSSEKHS